MQGRHQHKSDTVDMRAVYSNDTDRPERGGQHHALYNSNQIVCVIVQGSLSVSLLYHPVSCVQSVFRAALHQTLHH